MKNKLYSLFTSAMPAVWGIIMTLVLTLVLFVRNLVEYNFKPTFAVSNHLLALIGIITASLLFLIYIRQKKRIDAFFSKFPRFTPAVMSIALFTVQVFVFYNIFFVTGWDVYKIIVTAELVADPGEMIYDWYYEIYPNNLFITYLFGSVFKLARFFGYTETYAHVFILIVIQCFLACLTGYLVFKSVQSLIKNPVLPYIAWTVFALHVGLSPWISIPYSDAITLLIPIAVFRLFQLTENKRCLMLKWALIGALSFLGFKIKPQVLIILIAILIYEAVSFLCKSENRERLIKAAAYLACIIAVCLSAVFTNFVNATVPIAQNKDAAFGLTHFFMMGLNPESGGGFSPDDVYFSDSFDTQKERSKANIDKAIERLKALGGKGLVEYYAKKAMLNFDNGTYSWSMEGNFYYDVPEAPNGSASPFLRDIFYYEGEYYQHFATLQQYLWIMILLGNFGVIFMIRDKKMRSAVAVAVLALIGLTMFEMLFEARARYLFNYSPIFIVTASVGWYAMLKSAASAITSIKSKIIKKER